jgi:hypothetical protein
MATPARTITQTLVVDNQEAKALELEAMRLFTKGKNVRECGQFGNRSCKDRACVSCAERVSSVNAAKATRALRTRFANAHFVTVALPSNGPFDLGVTLIELRSAIAIWCRRAAVRKVIRGAVGSIEPKLGNRQTMWSCHAHLLVDCLVPEPDFGQAGEAWVRLTDGRGRLLVPGRGSRVGSTDDAARYCTKRQDWCPDPRTMPMPAHQQLLRAIKGRRLFIQWGTGLPAKEPRCRASV